MNEWITGPTNYTLTNGWDVWLTIKHFRSFTVLYTKVLAKENNNQMQMKNGKKLGGIQMHIKLHCWSCKTWKTKGNSILFLDRYWQKSRRRVEKQIDYSGTQMKVGSDAEMEKADEFETNEFIINDYKNLTVKDQGLWVWLGNSCPANQHRHSMDNHLPLYRVGHGQFPGNTIVHSSRLTSLPVRESRLLTLGSLLNWPAEWRGTWC